jgi:precorrin-8X/cobalt-precorrin-8 methylmutase
MTDYIKNPGAIEDTSMDIIQAMMANPDKFNDKELKVIKRIIHTTADFEMEYLIRFNGNPIEKCIEAISEGCKIYTDTAMIKQGINKKNLDNFGCQVVNFIKDEDIFRLAEEKNITRSMASIEKAYLQGNVDIFVIGNAPTALFRLLELIDENGVVPKAIIGVPVGFVGARESKDALMERKELSYIAIEGRKGGSAIGAAIINAIMKMMHNAG